MDNSDLLDAIAAKDAGRGVKIGILTSGGDAQGMNAVVRAAVRTAIHHGAVPYAIHEGWQGAVDGGDSIRPLHWDDVSSILHLGGTVIGTARCQEFRERSGLRKAAKNLVEKGIDRIVVIGGDGSLAGTDEFRAEWPSLLDELVESGDISAEVRAAHPTLRVAGVVGSIDNDLVGTDMTVGADSALHRIIDAIDAISSTAASHQRSFVVEVMGRHCGYLALMAAIAGGCDYVLIPEQPPATGWEEEMCELLKTGRAAGRRDSLVMVAEGARDQEGNPISAAYVRDVLQERLGEDTRVTSLGHVQRGGTPSAYDRWMSTLLGYTAALDVIAAEVDDEPCIVGVQRNRLARLPLMEAVRNTRAVAQMIKDKDFAAATAARGSSFTDMFTVFDTMANPLPGGGNSVGKHTGKRIAILHAGGLAPGMNTAARVAVRLGVDHGMDMLGVHGGFPGLIDGKVRPLTWGDVEGWSGLGGAELGTRRTMPSVEQLYALGRTIENERIDGLLLIGGINAYLAAHTLISERERYPAFNIPIVCVPASIDNNLPGSELSVGADTALNNIVEALDRIKQSASASRRCFVAETMGRRCGYLALMSAVAGGAERVYLHEEGIDLATLTRDTAKMIAQFESGKEFYLVVRNEDASENYTSDFLARIFEEEGGGLFDVRTAILGHMQQGGNPTPFDRLLATRFVNHAISELESQFDAGKARGVYIGLVDGVISTHPIKHMMEYLDQENRRPFTQWWEGLRPVLPVVADPSLTAERNTTPQMCFVNEECHSHDGE